MQKHRWKDLFKSGFRDLLVTGKVFYKTEILNGDPYVRRVDTRNISFDTAIDSDYLDESLDPTLDSYAFTSMGGTNVGGDFSYDNLSHLNSIIRVSEISPAERNFNGDVDIALRVIDNNSLVDKFIFKLVFYIIYYTVSHFN